MDSPGAQTPFALCTQEISTRLECMCMCATLNGLVDQEHAPPLPPTPPPSSWSLTGASSISTITPHAPSLPPSCGGSPW